MSRIFGFVLAIIVLGGVGYALFPYLRTTQEPVEVKVSSELEVTTETIREESETHRVDVTYPQFGIPAIDADIKKKVEAAVSEFQALPENPPESVSAQHTLDGSFEDLYIGPDVVSLALVLSQYTGGAHPLTIISGLNYERATSRQLLPNDAFAMIGMSVEEISEAATVELKAKLGDSMFDEGANSNPENFSSFTLSADEVTFIFQAYQVAAYATGPQEVSFPRTL